MEALVQDWLAALDAAAQARVADAIGSIALEDVVRAPLGRFFVGAAVRRAITGVLQGVAPYPWNVRPA